MNVLDGGRECIFGSSPHFVPTGGGACKSFCLAAWGGLKSGVVKPDSANGTNGLLRVQSLNLTAVQSAVLGLLERHPVLNCHVEERNNEPWLVPCDTLTPSVHFLDYGGHGDRNEAEGAIGTLVWSPFDLGTGPLYRAYAVRFGGEAYIGFVTHHFITDAIALQILMREFAELYHAALVDRPHTLSPVSLTYQDYLRAISHWVESGPGGTCCDAAADKLSLIPEINLRDRVDHDNSEEETFRFSQVFSTRVRQAARKFKVTPFIILLAAQNMMLRRYSSTEYVALKVITDGRELPQLAHVVGNLADRIYVLTDLSGAESFQDAVARSYDAFRDSLSLSFARHDFIQSNPRVAGVSTAAPVFNFRTVRKRKLLVADRQPSGGPSPLRVPRYESKPTRPRDAYYMVVFDDGEDIWGRIKYGAGRISGLVEELEKIVSSVNL